MSSASSGQSLRPLGAVPIRNEKGEITMQKVKVHRYVTGRKPKYAEKVYSSDEDESENEIELQNNRILKSRNRGSMAFTLFKKDFIEAEQEEEEDDDSEEDMRMKSRREKLKEQEKDTKVDDELLKQDPRMRRLMQKSRQTIINDDDEDLPSRRIQQGQTIEREIVKPQVLNRHREVLDAEAVDDDEANLDETVERRHELLKQRIQQLNLQTAAEESSDEDEEDEEDEEDDYDDYDSEEEGVQPRLKPIFVPKNERVTIIEKEEEEERRQAVLEMEKKMAAEERRRTAMKIIEEERRREEEEAVAKEMAEEEVILKGIAALLTDDEDDETGFALWKVRELKRIKRDKEEEEQREKERAEIERLRNMTEEERQAELAANPRVVTNQATKGKYRFLQKYYHRGAFYLDQDDTVFKRDFAQPTLEDHFDKTVLPSVMQVKNFGRAGRTKYTHLVDQDTTAFDQGWGDKNNQHAAKFHQSHGGGMKQSFDRPCKRKKT